MPKFDCPCCGNKTLESRWNYEICLVCFWEDEDYWGYVFRELGGKADPEDVMDLVSGANHCTLREARENFKKIGAVSESMVKWAVPPEHFEEARQALAAASLDIADLHDDVA